MNVTVISDHRSGGQALQFTGSATAAVSGLVFRKIDAPEGRRHTAEGARDTDRRDGRPKGFRTERRLKGFVTDVRGDKWRVTFVHNGEEFAYDLPADQLRKAGITAQFQPFEMDELVSTMKRFPGKVYHFRPLAKPEDAVLDSITLDAERQRKRHLIIKHFGKSKA